MRLESVSKLWTATVTLRLAEQRKLRLDDTVDDQGSGDALATSTALELFCAS